jgi:hypothetical protein
MEISKRFNNDKEKLINEFDAYLIENINNI